MTSYSINEFNPGPNNNNTCIILLIYGFVFTMYVYYYVL